VRRGPRWLPSEIRGLSNKWSLIWEVQTYAPSNMLIQGQMDETKSDYNHAIQHLC